MKKFVLTTKVVLANEFEIKDLDNGFIYKGKKYGAQDFLYY